MKKYPEKLVVRKPIELKLGIKSSFGKLKSPLALIYFLWISNKKPHTLQYTKEVIADNGDQELNLDDDVYSNFKQYVEEYIEESTIDNGFEEKINNNLMLTSQIEAIKVAIELTWKLGEICFCDSDLSFSAERQKKNNHKMRYAKEIIYSSNIDLLDLLISQKRKEMEKVLFSWLINKQNYSEEAKDLVKFFTNISDETVYRLRITDDNDIKFNMSGVYLALAEEDTDYVELSDYKENMGSLRILNSVLREELNAYIEKSQSSVTLKPGIDKNDIKKYAERISTRFALTNIDLSEIENIEETNEIIDNEKIIDEVFSSEKIDKPHQRIFFGAPGTGKSFKLNKEAEEHFASNYERVTFHPNYMYGNFVGAFKPFPKILRDQEGKALKDENGNIKETITYKYIPGPLMRILVKALKDRETNYLILIEEINRANVAAVFGDFFQLLDRQADGESEYPITTSEEVRMYLDMKFSDIDDEGTKTYIDNKIGSEYERLVLPSNLYIWSTMNSADQGVMPMDTAFKRRWEFTYIGIDDVLEDPKISNEFESYKFKISKESTVKWNDFRTEVNKRLSSHGVPEDKLLGPYFISKSILESEDIDKITDTIKNKVLMYLYDDAGKPYRNNLFTAEKSATYSALCRSFDENGKAIFKKPLDIEDKNITMEDISDEDNEI